MKSAEINGKIVYSNGLFYDCRSLSNLKINTPYTLGNFTFSGCTSLNLNLDEQDVDFSKVEKWWADYESTGDTLFDFVCDGVCNVTYHGDAPCAPWGAKTLNGHVDENGLVYSNENKEELLVCPTCVNEVTIPDKVEIIGDNAFEGCNNLDYVIYTGSKTSWTSIAVGKNNEALTNSSIVFLYINNGDYFAYMVNENEVSIIAVVIENINNNQLIVPDKIDGLPVTVIESDAFKDCKELKNIIIPDSIEVIGDSAFNGCRNLQTVSIGSNVSEIGENVFDGCEKLTSIRVKCGSINVDGLNLNTVTPDIILSADTNIINNNGYKKIVSYNPEKRTINGEQHNVIVFTGDYTLSSKTEYEFLKEIIRENPDAEYVYFEKISLKNNLCDFVNINNGEYEDLNLFINRDSGSPVLVENEEQGPIERIIKAITDFFVLMAKNVGGALGKLVYKIKSLMFK